MAESGDHMSDYTRVKEASIRGSGIGVFALLARIVIDLGSVVVLARLLSPADFGVVAMASTLLNFLRIIGDWGLVMASTQRPRLSDEQLSTLFWFNVVVSLILGLLAVGTAPLLVLVFGEKRIFAAAGALSVTLIGIGIGAQHEAIIRRRLSYGFLHVVSVLSQCIGLVVGIGGAFLGLGFWSLVLYQLVARLVHTALLWCGTRWVPRSPRKCVSIRQLIRYGNQLVPVLLLGHLARTVGEVIVGVTGGAAALGIFRRAHNVIMMIEQVKQPLRAVMPSSLSRLQDQEQEFSRFYLHAITLWSVVACGAIGYVAVDAALVVELVLGDQWLSAIPLVRWMAPAGLSVALSVASEWMLLPLGETKKLLIVRTVRTCSIVIGVLAGWQWGMVGIAAGYSIASCVGLMVELAVITVDRKVSVLQLMWALTRPLTAAAAAGGAVLLIPGDVSVGMFVLKLLLYSTVFLGVHTMLPGGWAVVRGLLRAARMVTARG